ncbi:hypothetical protein [Chlorobium sp. N1]|uniref:hypothetical protein n=1 Tax=Chlorobium sp. N1 TaxID=2491138 RepID=UPI00103FCC10|nr:hypothetical protein [Chlorobium sp. N1]TCD47543.1 hypothetical protein E0L29_06720 [Chlorobium sp. N1]
MQESATSISSILGVLPVLPGESDREYQKSLQSLLLELGATSPLQVYLAEKIHECLWWMHRYAQQKRAAVIAAMATSRRDFFLKDSPSAEHVRTMLLADTIDQKTSRFCSAGGNTLESTRQDAMRRGQEELEQLDRQIALQAKILTGLQKSFEVAVNRRTNAERLQLQNALLRRQLAAAGAQAEEEGEGGR